MHKKKTFVFFLIFILFFLFLSTLIPALKPAVLDLLRFPLVLAKFINTEISAVIFYRRNFSENQQLKKEISLIRQKLNNVEELSLENARLKELLSLKQKSPYLLIASRVIGRSPDNWSYTVIIDKGRHQGIRVGMVAISYLGLIGRVVETGQFTSKIMLINDPNFSVSGTVQRSRQEGLVVGALGNSLFMRYLPKDADIKVSDIIITSGLTELYPKGLIIGRVVEIRNEFSGLACLAVLKPAVNLSNIEEVLIITQQQENRLRR